MANIKGKATLTELREWLLPTDRGRVRQGGCRAAEKAGQAYSLALALISPIAWRNT